MSNRGGDVPAFAWPAGANGIGLAAALITTVLALLLGQLHGYLGMSASFALGATLAAVHFAIVLAVTLRTRSRVWAVYTILSLVGFVGISAVTPISAVLTLLRLNLGT